MKIKTKGNQQFNVPNTDEGRAFIADLRKYANRIHVQLMGRGKNRKAKGGNGQNLNPKVSDWIAVYIRRPHKRKPILPPRIVKIVNSYELSDEFAVN